MPDPQLRFVPELPSAWKNGRELIALAHEFESNTVHAAAGLVESVTRENFDDMIGALWAVHQHEYAADKHPHTPAEAFQRVQEAMSSSHVLGCAMNDYLITTEALRVFRDASADELDPAVQQDVTQELEHSYQRKAPLMGMYVIDVARRMGEAKHDPKFFADQQRRFQELAPKLQHIYDSSRVVQLGEEEFFRQMLGDRPRPLSLQHVQLQTIIENFTTAMQQAQQDWTSCESRYYQDICRGLSLIDFLEDLFWVERHRQNFSSPTASSVDA